MEFEEYFSFEAIVRDLVKWQVAGKDVGGMLPPRKMWRRAGVKDRQGVDPAIIRKQAILRTVRRALGRGGHDKHGRDGARPSLRGQGLDETNWGRKLLALVEDVQTAVFEGKVVFSPPRMIEITKGYKNGVRTTRRVAEFERLSDRVILSRMTAYVRDRLEGVLTDRCYSFRRDRNVTHRLAVERLQQYRAAAPVGSLFVSECDIKGFFDNISHEVVRRRWDEVGFDGRAGKVLEAYLGVYGVDGESNGQDVRCPSRGLPQGGSFSTVLANLVLAAADDAVAKVDDGRLFYARYCDDVIFVHPDREKCRQALAAYAVALEGLRLPMHPVQPFTYKPEGGGTMAAYYALKSKGPFRWGPAAEGEANCAPWVSFLGSQIRFDGEMRIRLESIEKHIRALGRKTAEAVRELQKGVLENSPRREIGNWFGHFRNGLIAKGVGYVTAKVEDCGLCWAGAFPLTSCAEAKMQMRRLDRIREGMLAKVRALLPTRYGMTSHRYKGRPFSYYGFLKKAVRPTNMNPRELSHFEKCDSSWWATLPYSEL